MDLKGGTERDLYQTAEGLRDRGHQVHLFCSEYGVPAPSDTVAHNIPVIPMGRTLRLWSFALLAPRIIKRHGCDVVVGFGRLLSQDVLRSGGGTHRDFLLRMAQQGGPVRKIWHYLSLYHQSLLQIEKRQFSDRRLMRVIAVSDEVRRDIESNYPIAHDRISVLYNGVDQQRFHPSRRISMRDRVRARWRVPDEAHLVLFVGSGFLRKGLDRLIAIWNRPHLSRVFLLVAGDDGRIGYYKNWAHAVAGIIPGRAIFNGSKRYSMKLFTGGAEPVYPEFRIYRHGRCKIWLNPTYADPKFIALLRNPDAFF